MATTEDLLMGVSEEREMSHHPAINGVAQFNQSCSSVFEFG